MRAVTGQIGFADALLARETPDGLMLVDGHARTEISGDGLVPVLVLGVDEAEADKLLATLDPLAGLAGTDQEALDALLAGISTDSEALQNRPSFGHV